MTGTMTQLKYKLSSRSSSRSSQPTCTPPASASPHAIIIPLARSRSGPRLVRLLLLIAIFFGTHSTSAVVLASSHTPTAASTPVVASTAPSSSDLCSHRVDSSTTSGCSSSAAELPSAIDSAAPQPPRTALASATTSESPSHPHLPTVDSSTMSTTSVASTLARAAAASTAAAAPAGQLGSVSITPRLSSARGHADHGWLNSYHTFSFASYHDSRFDHFHSLRVINEDRVSAGEGFGRHPHREFEIFSLIVHGHLRHKDSLGNEEVLGRGAIQFTSAGTGISHSEYNASDKPGEFVHFIQMWVKPSQSGLKPSYSTRQYEEADKLNRLQLILSEDGREGSIQLHQDQSIYTALLEPGKAVEFTVQPGREVYLHLIQDVKSMNEEYQQTALRLQDDKQEVTLHGGDGAFIRLNGGALASKPQTFQLTGAGLDGKAKAEFILFDVKKE